MIWHVIGMLLASETDDPDSEEDIVLPAALERKQRKRARVGESSGAVIH